MMPITYRRITITPALARAYLVVNAENNRNVKRSKIESYARDMLSGNWNSDSGETIKLSETGRLIDGQNRMHAVIKAGIPIDFDIAHGLPDAAMLVLDSGASRTGADALKVSGATDRMRSGAIVRWSILWDAGVFMGQGGAVAPTNTEINTRYLSDPDGYDSAATRSSDCQRRGLGAGRVAGMAFYLFARIDREQTHQFFDQFISGANLVQNSGPLVLRNRLARIRMDRITGPEQLALFIRSWNAFRSEKTVSQLIIVKGALTNSNFPQPK